MIAFYLFTTTKLRWLKVFVLRFCGSIWFWFAQIEQPFFRYHWCHHLSTIETGIAFWLNIGVFGIGLCFLFSKRFGCPYGNARFFNGGAVSIWNTGMTFVQAKIRSGVGPLTYMNSFGIMPYHGHSLYIDTILSYGLIGTILLSISSVIPVHMMMDMSQESGKRPIIGLYLSFATVAVHGIFDLALFWIRSGFIFTFSYVQSTTGHRSLVSEMTD